MAPPTVLPIGFLVRLFRPHWNYTVVLDDHSVGKIGNSQERVFEVRPGEHRLYMRFVGLRRSEELQMSLKEDEEQQFLCGTSGMGWPIRRRRRQPTTALLPTSDSARSGSPPDEEQPRNRPYCPLNQCRNRPGRRRCSARSRA